MTAAMIKRLGEIAISAAVGTFMAYKTVKAMKVVDELSDGIEIEEDLDELNDEDLEALTTEA